MPRRNDYHSPRREDSWRGAHRDDSRRYGEDGHRFGEDGRRYGDGGRRFGEDARRYGDGGRRFGEDGRRYGDGGRRFGEDDRRYGDDGRNDGKRVARKGDRLQIHYTCFDEDGKKLESTHDGGPAPTITLGGGDVLKALEKAFTGMAAGERKTVTLEPKDAFPYDEDLVTEVTPEKWQLDEPPKVGMTIDVLDAPDDVADEDVNEDDIMQGVVTEILNDGTAIVDCNHPLADKTLTFELELVRIL